MTNCSFSYCPPNLVADSEASETRGAAIPAEQKNPFQYCSNRYSCDVCQQHDRDTAIGYALNAQTGATVARTLAEREKNYGDFTDSANVAQDIKRIIRSYIDSHPVALERYMEEALDLIASKIGRLLSGNRYHVDGWHDIAGYATLVEQRLNKRS